MIVALTLPASGCAVFLVGSAAAAGAGVVAYVRGELKSTESVSLDEAWTATQAAMKDLELVTTRHEKDGFTAKLTARATGDREVQVALKHLSERSTEVKVRVGLFGDEAMSLRILGTIQGHFGHKTSGAAGDS